MPEHPACRAAVASAAARIQALRQRSETRASSPSLDHGGRTVTDLHRGLGLLMIEVCGISRSAPELRRGLQRVADLRAEFEADLRLPDHGAGPDEALERALRLDDFLGLADLMLRDALAREESCGAHFREEHQTAAGEALRDDERFAHIAAWEHRPGQEPLRHQEPLSYSAITPKIGRAHV